MKYFLILLLPLLAACSRSASTEFWGHRYSFAKNISYGVEKEQVLDIFCQGEWIGEPYYWKSDTMKHPTLVYIHGGGWLGGSKERVIPFVIPYLEKGFNVVLLDYRTGENTAPQAVDDCMLALKWVSMHANDFNINLHQIYISGESAGGHLALITGLLNTIPGSHQAYSGDSITIRSIINWFGITDIAAIDSYFAGKGEIRNYASVWVGHADRMDSISKIFSPIHRLGANSPPVISIHGQKDSVVPHEQAMLLHQLLNEKGVRNKVISLPDGKHLGFSARDFEQIYKEIFTFLENYDPKISQATKH